MLGLQQLHVKAAISVWGSHSLRLADTVEGLHMSCLAALMLMQWTSTSCVRQVAIIAQVKHCTACW